MQHIGAFEAKTRLSELLNIVHAGKSIAITKHGKIFALLVPPEPKPQLEITEAIAGIDKLRQKIIQRKRKITLKDIQEMKNKGRK